MPIYEYKCSECGGTFESLVQNLSAAENQKCPACGSQRIDKLLSLPNIQKEFSTRSGTTCCGREERCEKPPCSTEGHCRRG
jgi:putative FmdB family regulatory protein